MAAAASVAADAAGWTHASAHLNHYLDNSGKLLTINADAILRDVSAADTKANAIAETEIRRITTEASAAQNYDNPVQFQSQWSGFYITRALSDDWFFAMGGIHLSVTGVVTVHKPAEGAEASITAEYKVHVHDRYNWDGDKGTAIAGVTVSDKSMGALHTAGLAREYDIEGSSAVRRYEGTVPSAGPVNLPGATGGRDGERSDPTR
ncbi:hypothetical protein [Nocardia gipuzkoensis]|uniref:hypothetical protein n=1 Tax=Nocardia gipuzkoensis TaxID=2749991 RepID=UPI00237D4942|nr:hypothetical protein [Nocardia gipuzkoensis]MDE1671256.1 hypothetical protein [Nocardia gipuzkoensis]